MEDQLISLTTAKLAKEKGLQDSIIIHTNNYIHYWQKGRWGGSEWKIDWYGEAAEECIFAPTQSLLQRWLREKHNLSITIGCNKFGDAWYAIIHNYKTGAWFSKIDDKSTYEEALESGLIQALERIN